MKKVLISTIALVALLMSCGLDGNRVNKGSIFLNINNGNSRLIDTNKDMTVTKYSILIKDAAGVIKVNETLAAGSSLNFGPFDFGTYSVDVKGLNASEVVILVAEAPVDVLVKTGIPVPANITISPVEGTGSIDLKVLWTESQLQNSNVSATLTPLNGAVINLDVTKTEGEAVVRKDNVPTGYQTLILELKDNDALARGAVEIVRIEDQASSGVKTYDFRADQNGNGGVNNNGGSLDIVIDAKLENPLSLELYGTHATIAPGATVTLTAFLNIDTDPELNATDNIIYTWYDGTKVIDSAKTATAGDLLTVQYTAPTELGPDGQYVTDLTVIAYKADGSRAGDAKMSNVLVKEAGSGSSN